MDDFDMYADESETESPKPLGPVAMLFRKVDRLEAELRSTKDELARLRRMVEGSSDNMTRLRTRFSVAENKLDSVRNRR